MHCSSKPCGQVGQVRLWLTLQWQGVVAAGQVAAYGPVARSVRVRVQRLWRLQAGLHAGGLLGGSVVARNRGVCSRHPVNPGYDPGVVDFQRLVRGEARRQLQPHCVARLRRLIPRLTWVIQSGHWVDGHGGWLPLILHDRRWQRPPRLRALLAGWQGQVEWGRGHGLVHLHRHAPVLAQNFRQKQSKVGRWQKQTSMCMTTDEYIDNTISNMSGQGA